MQAFLETRTYENDFPLSSYICKDNNFLAHWHIDVEIVYVCEGNIMISVNDESRVLKKGDMAVINSTDIHRYDSTNMQSEIIVIIFHPELIGHPAGWPEERFYNPVFIESSKINRLDKSSRDNLLRLIHEIAKEYNAQKPFFENYLQGLIIQLTALLQRHFMSPLNCAVKKRIRLPDIGKIKKAIEYINQNYRDEITLDTISEIVDLSPAYFSRLFAKYSGTNFNSYLGRIRVNAAEKLIKTTQDSIISIAYECGFNSIRTFNRTFKSLKGCSPSQLKKTISTASYLNGLKTE
ncbi:MAG: AraC family transcriptional regulator [Clostridiaceae bacterium]|nr:AraC family transcriptional regulator [Clostridiaceae bacterium]